MARKIIQSEKSNVYSIDRYDILIALMRSSQTQNEYMKLELSKLIFKISRSERTTRQYISSINIQINGNEKLLKYIEESA